MQPRTSTALPLLLLLSSGCAANPPTRQGHLYDVQCACNDADGAAQLSLAACIEDSHPEVVADRGVGLCHMAELQVEARTGLNAECENISVGWPTASCPNPGDFSITDLRP